MKRVKKTGLGVLSLLMLCQIGWADGELEARHSRCPQAHKRHYLADGVRAVIDLEGGLRFDNLRHEGPSNITLNATNPPTIADSGINNRLSQTLVERALKGRVIFYDVAFIQTNLAYGVAANATHMRQSVDWDPIDGVPQNGYYDSNAYSYDANISVGGQIRWNSWASNSFELGWGYQRLRLSTVSDTRYAAPFIKLGSKFEFLERWTAAFSGAYHFAGSRKEEVTPVLLGIFGVNVSSFLLDTAYITSGHVSGGSIDLSIGYAFSKNWGASLNYEFKGFKSSRKRLGPSWYNDVSGTWNERTLWFSNRVHMAIDYSF